MINRNTKRQHYVQSALTASWEREGAADVAIKINGESFVQGNKKPASALFFEDFMYEQVYGFQSAESHIKGGMTLHTDENHVFRMNDGELYCKNIEDKGLPIIRKLVGEAKLGKTQVSLTKEECQKLDEYLILQALRTPAARNSFMFEKGPKCVGVDDNDSSALIKYVENVTYLFMMGLYDKTGISDNHPMPESFYEHLLHIIKDMSAYLLVLLDRPDEFIIGDNPCVLLGAGTGISALLMPFDPKVALLLCADEGKPHTCFFDINSCSDAWLHMEYYTQIQSSREKVVFNSDVLSIEELNKYIHLPQKSNYKLDVWTVKTMVEYLQKNDDTFDINKYI